MKLLVSSVALLASCSLSVPDLNNPSPEDLEDPTAEEIHALAVGLAIAARAEYAQPSGIIGQLGTLGRESYNFDQNDPRFVSELLMAPALGASSIGSSFWTAHYSNIGNANLLLNAVGAVPELSDEQKEGLRGYAKTFQAMDYLIIANTHRDTGAPIIPQDQVLGDDLPPIDSYATVLAHVATLLTEANTHLAAAGDAFSFALPGGWAGFDAPAGFAQVNRALAARVELYRGNHQAALDALGDSFQAGTPGDEQFNTGVSHVFGTGAGDTVNGLVSPNLFAHPSLAADAEAGDARLSKLTTVDETTFSGLTATEQFTLYTNPSASIPIIRNEELWLIQAEANWALDQLVLATQAINFVRNGHGLPNTTAATSEEIRDEILTQRRYSLMFEGHAWVDAIRLGMLTSLPNPSGGNFHTSYPLPQAEQDARL